jgi:type II secretory pathway pseudopilin PulG
MSTHSHQGFTIIETMLFLAITGALFAALMIGVGTGITQQRYLDSVRSYRALLQNQYAAVLNTKNNANIDQWKCNAANGKVGNGITTGNNGASDCVILGRAIQIVNGATVTTSSVTGYEPSQADQAKLATSTDLEALELYNPQLADFDVQQTQPDWQSLLYTYAPTGGTNPKHLSSTIILILRSPSSGTVKVFGSPSPLTGSIKDFLANLGSQTSFTDCVDGDSGLLPKQIVTVNTTIASIDGVSAGDVPSGKECY